MKRSLLILLAVLLLGTMAMGEVTTDVSEKPYEGGRIFTYEVTIDSIEVDTSRIFDLSEWDGMLTRSDANMFEVPAGYYIYSDSGDTKASIKIQGSFDKSVWFDAVTVVNSDTSETATKTVLDFGEARFPYYWIISSGVATNDPYTAGQFWMYFPWKEEE